MQEFFDLFKYDNNLIVAKHVSGNEFNYITLSLIHDNTGLSFLRGILKRRKFIYFRDIIDVYISYEKVSITVLIKKTFGLPKTKVYHFRLPNRYQANVFYKGIKMLSV